MCSKFREKPAAFAFLTWKMNITVHFGFFSGFANNIFVFLKKKFYIVKPFIINILFNNLNSQRLLLLVMYLNWFSSPPQILLLSFNIGYLVGYILKHFFFFREEFMMALFFKILDTWECCLRANWIENFQFMFFLFTTISLL